LMIPETKDDVLTASLQSGAVAGSDRVQAINSEAADNLL